MPILRVDPNTGESLDKAKTAEQAVAEEAARVEALAEYKERVKEKKPRKKKAIEPEVIVEAKKEAGIVIKAAAPISVKVNPILAPNGEINAEELIAPLDAILEEIEHSLQLMTKGYKLSGDKADILAPLNLPEEFEYKPSVTRVSSEEEAFSLVKPTGITTLKYKKVNKDLYVDRVFFKPIDIKELLKDGDKAKELLKKVVIDGMWKNLWETKQLDSKKKYFGTTVARIKRLEPINGYSAVNHSYDEAMIEIRMFSDITELPKEVK